MDFKVDPLLSSPFMFSVSYPIAYRTDNPFVRHRIGLSWTKMHSSNTSCKQCLDDGKMIFVLRRVVQFVGCGFIITTGSLHLCNTIADNLSLFSDRHDALSESATINL